MSSFSGTSCPARSQTARGTCCRTCLGSGLRDSMSEGHPLHAVYGGLVLFQKRLTSTTASPGTCVKVNLIKDWRPHSSNRFAIELNEVTGVEQGKIPPTDARWGVWVAIDKAKKYKKGIVEIKSSSVDLIEMAKCVLCGIMSVPSVGIGRGQVEKKTFPQILICDCNPYEPVQSNKRLSENHPN